MNKKIICYIGSIIVGAIIFSIIGFLALMNYGGNNCDQPPEGTCDCFCCHMFNSRGYEACAQFGFYAGLIIGAFFGGLICRIIFKKYKID